MGTSSPTPPEQARETSAGVNRAHHPSRVQKIAFWGLHLACVLLAVYVLYGGGLGQLGKLLGKSWTVTEPTRAALVLGAASLYWLRHGVTLFVLLQRKVIWSEALGLVGFMLFFEVGLCILATGLTRATPLPLAWLDGVAIALVLVGSYLNTFSELQRKWWKQDPNHKGRCYTEGLFRYSMHINYFGDCVMFTGWCLLTGVLWTLILPAMMTAMFIFYHIPGLDAYLEERYGDEFRAYASKTKKLIPFVY